MLFSVYLFIYKDVLVSYLSLSINYLSLGLLKLFKNTLLKLFLHFPCIFKKLCMMKIVTVSIL